MQTDQKIDLVQMVFVHIHIPSLRQLIKGAHEYSIEEFSVTCNSSEGMRVIVEWSK